MQCDSVSVTGYPSFRNEALARESQRSDVWGVWEIRVPLSDQAGLLFVSVL
jgi:hypothetical protein